VSRVPRSRVTLLGCGSSGGVPTLGGPDGHGNWGACDPAEPANRRTRSSIVIEAPGGGRLLVDAGPDLRAQFLAAGIARIDAVLFTHAHADHIMGIDELRAINRLTGKPLPAFATAETLTVLRRRFDYAFLPPTPGFYRPCLEPVPVRAGEALTVAGIALTLLRLDHAVMETLGLRVGGFAYCTDVVRIPSETLEALHGLDTWIVGCFQRQPHKVHADLATVLGWVERLRPRRTVLTHMSHDLDYATLRRMLPPGVEPGRDGLVLEIGAAEDA
jgi:phosphoribosyl 1,2-cyclic phosphate phosphodiesterase